MSMTLGRLWQRSVRWLKIGWLIMAGVVAIYIGAIQPLQSAKEIRSQRATGLGAVGWEPTSLWRQARLMPSREKRSVAGVVGGVPGGIPADEAGRARQSAMMAYLSTSAEAPDRKIERNSALELIVNNPARASEKIRVLAEQLGGYLESLQVSGGQNSPSATITIRVPVARLEEARTEIKKLATRVDSEKTDAKDVTKEYVDLEARLRNLRAEEAQYLAIMKRANTVKDTLEVSEKLSEVRGQIEQQQAEFEALSKQVETVAITVGLRTQAEAQVFGLRWRPLCQLKLAVRDGVDGLADYAATMASVVFYLPTILLWLMTILLGAAVGWRILRWAARFLAFPKTAAAGEAGR